METSVRGRFACLIGVCLVGCSLASGRHRLAHHGEPEKTRILNGRPTKSDEFPFQARILNDGGTQCTGSILDSWHVLTAAHCVASPVSSPPQLRDARTLLVVVGDYSAKNWLDGQVIHQVEKLHVHEDFKLSPKLSSHVHEPSYLLNDVALIETRTPIRFKRGRVERVFLSSASNQSCGAKVVAIGWGKIDEVSTSDRLLAFNTNLIKCPFEVQANHHFCSAPSRWASICYGDSGGPLLRMTPIGYEQIGFVSFGERGNCAIEVVYYVNVSHFRAWIDERLVHFRPAAG